MTTEAVIRGADTSAMREAFARLPAGVSVVTSLGPEGPCGLTASAVCPVSIDPPLLLVCVANASRTLDQVRRHGRFAVNTLRVDGRAIAQRFAARETHDKFALVPYRMVDAVPVLTDALGHFTCTVVDALPGGDHTIVVGRVNTVDHVDGDPLLWHARAYHGLSNAWRNE